MRSDRDPEERSVEPRAGTAPGGTYTYRGEPVAAQAVARLALLELYGGGPHDPDGTLQDVPLEGMLVALGQRLHVVRTSRSPEVHPRAEPGR